MAGKCAFDSGCMPSLINQCIVVSQFFAALNLHQRINEDAAIVVLQGFAIRLAGMVDEARIVAAACAIDYAAIGQAEEEGMVDGGTRRFRTLLRGYPFDPLTLILDDALACRYPATRKDTVAMYIRRFDFIRRQFRREFHLVFHSETFHG